MTYYFNSIADSDVRTIISEALEAERGHVRRGDTVEVTDRDGWQSVPVVIDVSDGWWELITVAPGTTATGRTTLVATYQYH